MQNAGKYGMINTDIKTQFLSTEEIDWLAGRIISASPAFAYHDEQGIWKDQGLVANIHEWDWNSETMQDVKQLLSERLRPWLGNFAVEKSHILDARLPWEIHNDYEIVCSNTPNQPQAVVVIPIEDSVSQTVVFDQHALHSNFAQYRNDNAPFKDCVPVEQWDQLLSHCRPKDRFWLTINCVFPWHKGDMVVMDRQTFHASDSFHKSNVQSKRAIILFTSWPL